MGQSKNSPRMCRARVRALEAFRLRMEGKHYWEIGQLLHMTEDGARRAVKRAMDDTRERLQETVQEHVELDLARIEAAIRELWPLIEMDTSAMPILARVGARETQLKAMAQLEKLLARKAKLLGLDAPDRLEVAGKDGEPMTFRVTWPEDKT